MLFERQTCWPKKLYQLEAIRRWLAICLVWPLRLLPDLCITNIHRPDQSTTGCYGNIVYKTNVEAKLCRILQLALTYQIFLLCIYSYARPILTSKIRHVHLLVLIWERLQMPTTTTTPDATVQSLGRHIANHNVTFYGTMPPTIPTGQSLLSRFSQGVALQLRCGVFPNYLGQFCYHCYCKILAMPIISFCCLCRHCSKQHVAVGCVFYSCFLMVVVHMCCHLSWPLLSVSFQRTRSQMLIHAGIKICAQKIFYL